MNGGVSKTNGFVFDILALRQQLGVLKRKQPRPRLRIQDRMFWVLLRRLWPAWSNVLVIVKPETVVAWHRREAFPESCPYRYMILDRDAKFGKEVTDLLTASGVKPTRTSFACPWQNGIAERWIGSCRNELLDYVIVLNEIHLRRLIRDYISYYHADRIHDSLGKDAPAMRPVSPRLHRSGTLVSFPRVGGLHHRYDWQQEA